MRSFALVCALLVVAGSASAADVRYPAAGSPAITAQIPDAWSAKEAGGKLVAKSADGSTTVIISIVPYQGTLDALAADTMKAENIDAPRESERHAVLVADMNGFWWPSFQIGADGKSRYVFFCDVMLDNGHGLTGAVISPDDEGADYHAGLHLLDRMRLAPK